MDENEEREYNDIESLAAYLHSGKMQTMKAAEERAELGLPAEDTDKSDDDLEGVLFTLGKKKRKKTKDGRKVISRSEYDSTVRRKPEPSPESFVPYAEDPVPAPVQEQYSALPEKNADYGQPVLTFDGEPAASDPGSAQQPGIYYDPQYQPIQPVQQSYYDPQYQQIPPVQQNNYDPMYQQMPPLQQNNYDPQYQQVPPVQQENYDPQYQMMPPVQQEYYDTAQQAPDFSAEQEYGSEIKQQRKKTKDKKPSRVKRSGHKSEIQAVAPIQSEAGISSLAESLSASLGEKAAELVEKEKDALPPEDTPEVFDITEGSAEEAHFDSAATRLMNAVTHAPQSMNESIREEIENEREEIHEERVMASRLRRSYERQKQSTRTLAYILIALVLCAAILGAAAFASSYVVRWALDFSGVASTEFMIDIEIPDNADIDTIAAILSENNIINDAKFFKFFAGFYDKLKDNDESKEFIGGKYTVSSTMPYSTLLKLFRTETTDIKTVDVRIVEGMTSREIGELLEKNNVCFAEDFEKYYKNIQNVYDFERRVKESSSKMYQLEGYLFPDTYQFYVVNGMENGGKAGRNETEEEAYDKMRKESEKNARTAAMKMYSNFNEKITRSMYKKMGEMNLTLDEVIALASIIQKEAADPDDMKNVAGVFLNRIRHSAEYPYLQSDVTVLYAENEIKPYFKGTDAALSRLCNAYNTYVCQGIPAGPVCNPGIDAINAVLYSTDHEYFYFCANEETGEIFYAQTKEEHEQNLVLAGLAGNTDNPEDTGNGEESGRFE